MRNVGIRDFRDLEAWKESHFLALNIYKITLNFPPEERFGITNQIRRAATSISANIAEGFSRYHFKDKKKFYYQARGSLAETRSFLLLAKDLGYLENDLFRKLDKQAVKTRQLINGLIRSCKNLLD